MEELYGFLRSLHSTEPGLGKDLSFRATIFQLHHRIQRKMSGLGFGSGTEVVNLPTKLVCNEEVPKRRFRMCGNEHCPCCRVNYDKLKGKTCWLPGFATRGPIVAPIKFMIAPCVSILCVCVWVRFGKQLNILPANNCPGVLFACWRN